MTDPDDVLDAIFHEPPPSPAEAEASAERLRARNRLVVEHKGLAGWVAKRFRGRGRDFDDLAQVALIALIGAASAYRGERGAFAPFAIVAMKHALIRSVQARRPPSPAGDLLDDLGDPEAAPVDAAALESDERDRVRRAVARLPARQRRVLELRFGLADGGDGLMLEEVGREMGVSREAVRLVERRGLDHLRWILG